MRLLGGGEGLDRVAHGCPYSATAERRPRDPPLSGQPLSSRSGEVRPLLRAPAPPLDGRARRGAAAGDALEQVELADRLGIDYVWEVEHHFLEEYSHSSAPEVFLAAVSQRTERHPARPRDRPGAAGGQPPRAGRRAGRDPRPDLRGPGRVRDRRGQLADRARRLRGGARAASAPSGRRRWTRSRGCSSRSRSPAMRAAGSRCRPATWSRSPSSGRTRRCGWRAAGARRS